MNVWTKSAIPYQPLLGFTADPETLGYTAVFGPVQSIEGFKLIDGRASYGVGIETFALGFPIHFDWSWRTLFNREWEDAVFAYQGGSAWFRKPRFSMWIRPCRARLDRDAERPLLRQRNALGRWIPRA